MVPFSEGDFWPEFSRGGSVAPPHSLSDQTTDDLEGSGGGGLQLDCSEMLPIN